MTKIYFNKPYGGYDTRYPQHRFQGFEIQDLPEDIANDLISNSDFELVKDKIKTKKIIKESE